MPNPNINNLRKRAKLLGLVITKASDASVTGYCEYVLHRPHENWEVRPMLSLWGIMHKIEAKERLK